MKIDKILISEIFCLLIEDTNFNLFLYEKISTKLCYRIVEVKMSFEPHPRFNKMMDSKGLNNPRSSVGRALAF
jgi:hypothetical protein